MTIVTAPDMRLKGFPIWRIKHLLAYRGFDILWNLASTGVWRLVSPGAALPPAVFVQKC